MDRRRTRRSSRSAPRCIADQYAQYTVVDDIKINSKLTLGEDVADLGGTILAYMAWKDATADQRLQPVDGLTPDQRFFVGFAQWACGDERPESKRVNAITNPHSPLEVPHQRRGGEHAGVRGGVLLQGRASRWSRTRTRSAGSGDGSRARSARGGLTDGGPRHVFVTGGTGYLGRRLIPRLLARGHRVRALARPGSEERLPSGCDVRTGNALDAATFASAVAPADTFVQLVGTPHPSPAKAKEFVAVDLASVQASATAAAGAGVGHFVYVSVAHPAPVMQAYVAVRAEGEAMLAAAGLRATILRPWYVLGPGHRWAATLAPLYWMAERRAGDARHRAAAGPGHAGPDGRGPRVRGRTSARCDARGRGPRHPARHVVRRPQTPGASSTTE